METDLRWPVVEGIAWRRGGREELRAAAVEALDLGDPDAALRLLLADQDDWSPTPPPAADEVAEVVAGVSAGMTLREAMAGLGFGPVGDYFAHRLGDPTYLSGLALLGRHLPPGRPVVLELACGIGHYLRDLATAGARVAGVDVVFAKLWLARRFLVPDATLLCVDATDGLPLPTAGVDLALCHDALYFLADKPRVAAELRRVAGPDGTVLVGHAHNALVDNLSAGAPLDPAGYAALLPGATLYDDAELTRAWLDGRAPHTGDADGLAGAAAVALATGPDRGRRDVRFGSPAPGTPLAANPIYADPPGDPVVLEPVWPSARYAEEYAATSGHLSVGPVARAVLERAAAGRVGADPAVDALAARRAVLDLPDRW